MPMTFSKVVGAESRRIPGFKELQFVDLDALGVHGSPLTVLDDFRVEELPFSAHPHAGFSAVTYVFPDSRGGVRSRTSTGADLVIGPGGIVWTQAAGGVVHEEVPARRGEELHGLQLFVNLSSRNKLAEPKVLSLDGGGVPEWSNAAADRVRVVVGSHEEISSPLVPDEPFTMLDVALRSGIRFAKPSGHNTVVYVVGGGATVRAGVDAHGIGRGQALALSGDEASVTLEVAEGTGGAQLLVLSGPAIDEPIVEEGPFIMNDRSQIESAMARYRSGGMGGLSPGGF
jgi:redox-sensitive bicupin YhaK (pirin superfamily)